MVNVQPCGSSSLVRLPPLKLRRIWPAAEVKGNFQCETYHKRTSLKSVDNNREVH
ncbi:MAG: hypothetical protein ACTS4T_01575 [Candidatus Hodgkinia cicadicola]